MLLYWGAATAEWFMENYVDLRKAERARQQANRPFLSRGIILDRPPEDPDHHLAPAAWVVPNQDLQPFLAPFRKKAGA